MGIKIHKGLILTIIGVAQLMDVLDNSITGVALPTIYKQLHFTSTNTLQWVTTGYALALGGFLLLGGRAADIFGRRKTFLYGVGAFTVASFMTGIAQNSTMLEVTRIIQGLCAAFISPAALSILLITFAEGKARNRALGLWGGIAAGGAAIGLLLGGIITQYLGWRWNFFLNVPIGLLVLIFGSIYLPHYASEKTTRRSLDLSGAALVVAGLITLVYGLTQVPIHGWGSSACYGFLLLSVVLLTSFVLNEKIVSQPLLPLGIFRTRNIAAANTVNFINMAGMFAMFFFLTLYMQTILDFSPLRTGLAFLPITLLIGIGSGLVARLVSSIGYKIPMIIGPCITAAGLIMLAQLHIHGTYLHTVFPGLSITAIGIGMSFVAITIAATNGIPAQFSGLGSGLLNTSQQVGGSLGLALLSGISSKHTTEYAEKHSQTAASLLQAQVVGYRAALYAGACFVIIAAIIALCAVRRQKGEKVTFNPNAALGA